MSSVVQAKTPFGGRNSAGAFEITGGNASATADLSFNAVEGTAFSGHPNKGAVVIDFTARMSDEATSTFLDERITTASTETVEVFFEDGSKIQESTAEGSVISDIYIVPFKKTQADTKARVFIGRGIISGDSGNISTSYNAFAETPLQVTTISNPSAVTIPAAAFTSLGLTLGTVTLATGSFGLYTFATEA